MLDSLKQGTPFIAFVGAGASAIEPSFLPSWRSFNNLLLESLCEQVATYSRHRQPTDEILARFKTRRDETQFFAPDFQAQLIEEEIGADYFKVWQSLEADQFSPAHGSLALLASQGRVQAIITTNFDRLIEKALEFYQCPYTVYHNPNSFDQLINDLDQNPLPTLPVIKIHGSIEDAPSLIDTLKKRLAGRPPALLAAVQALLSKAPWLYLGFSGADFSYNPHYLGILDAASDAKGFVFLAREGTTIQEGVKLLADSYGEHKAEIVFGDLTTWLSDTFELEFVIPKTVSDRGREEVIRQVKSNIQEWVNELGPMAVVNVICAMLDSSGLKKDALWLQRRTWKRYRNPDDTQGPSYWRYNYNYGTALLDVGRINNPVELADDKHNLLEWRHHADQIALHYLFRSYENGNMMVAGAQLAKNFALGGHIEEAVRHFFTASEQARENQNRLEYCDITIAGTTLLDIIQSYTPTVHQLLQCLDIALELGDEPRRAEISSLLGRFLTYAGEFEAADGYISNAQEVALRLDLHPLLISNQAIRGLWLTDSDTSQEEAIALLSEALKASKSIDEVPLFIRNDIFQPDKEPEVVYGINPLRCRLLLDLNRAAMHAGKPDIIEKTLDELDVVATTNFPGYCTHYYINYAQCVLTSFEGDIESLASELLNRAINLGNNQKNQWAVQEANRLFKLWKTGKESIGICLRRTPKKSSKQGSETSHFILCHNASLRVSYTFLVNNHPFLLSTRL